MGRPKRQLPEASPTRRPHFRSAPKDGAGRGTLGRGWGRQEAQPPGDSTRTVTSGRGRGHDFTSRHRYPNNSFPIAPKQERPEKFLKTPGSSHQSGAEELESVTRSGSEGWDSQGGSEVPQTCKAPSVPPWTPQWPAGAERRTAGRGVRSARGPD